MWEGDAPSIRIRGWGYGEVASSSTAIPSALSLLIQNILLAGKGSLELID